MSQDFWAGLTGGIMLGALTLGGFAIIRDQWVYRDPLNECARVHAVYECQWLATPQVQPEWVPEK